MDRTTAFEAVYGSSILSEGNLKNLTYTVRFFKLLLPVEPRSRLLIFEILE